VSVDAGFDVDIDTVEGREQDKPKKKKGFDPVSFGDFYKRYSYVANLIEAYPELQQYYNDILEYYNNNNGQMPPANWLKEKRAQNPWFQARDSNQEAFDFARQDPALQDDVNTALRRNQAKILRWAAQRGIEIPDERLEELTLDATRNKWADDDVQLELNLGVFLAQGGQPGDLRGSAGEFETELLTWSRKNGINLSQDAIRQYIQRLTLNQQSIDDAKQEIRETYMVGAYPAWEEQIRGGTDPDSIISPYRARVSSLLEIPEENLGWDDPLVQKAMQNVDAEGKPRVMPLWEYEREVRKDTRWQQTDNAYATYAKVGNDLLRMFGLR